jgi:O-antigen/teichoic acid export membrane protein
MTVSNVVAPVLLYADRFVIANRVSLEAVTFYAAPFEIISRLSVFPVAIMGVVFPAFSHSLATDGDDARALYRRSTLAVACLTAPAAAVMVLLARPALTAWLGPAFAERSAGVAAILAVGVLVHALAQPPFNLLQAAGRPDVTARLHLLEAPLYLVYLLWLTGRFGITGTACAWLLRVSLSMVALRWLARRVVLACSARESRP